jgi:hypothetical protein
MAYQENPDHVPDPTAHYGTLDTTGVFGGDHGDASKVSGVWDAARDADLAGADFSDEDTYSDADREKLAAEQEKAQERSATTGQLIVPNPIPEGTLHIDEVLTPQEQAQRLDPDSPDPLVLKAQEQGYDVPDNAYKGGAAVSGTQTLDGPDGPSEPVSEPAPESGVEPAAVEAEGPFNPSDHTVEEVNAYLTDGSTSDEEANRVLEAERADKNRKGVVGE